MSILDNSNLVKAKLAVMRECGYVQKQGRIQGQGNYTYAKESDFIAAIRPAMIEAGLTFTPVACEVIKSETNDKKVHVVLTRTFRLSHESGEHEEISTVGEGIDYGDKACNKAMTAAKKYALREAFLIETGDDPDDTSSEALTKPKPAPKPAPKPDVATIIANIETHCKTIEQLQTYFKANVKGLTPGDLEAVVAAKDKRKAELTQVAQ